MVTVQAAGGGMNVRMHKNPFDGLSQMSAPDLSFWSQMENTSLFCNSAAFAAATEAIGNTPGMPSMSSALFPSPALDGSHSAFQSLAQLPGAFNLNSLTHPHHADLDTNPFDPNVLQHGSLHSTPSSQNNFWSSTTTPPRRDNLAGMNFGNPHSGHNATTNPLGQKLPADFRTVMLPTESEKIHGDSPQHRSLNHNPTNSPTGGGHLDHLGYGNANSGSNNNLLTVGNTVACQVCISAPSNGLHFGAKVCAACAAFFRRSVSDDKKYICKRNQRCTLKVTDSTGYRKICRECRFKKCLYIGMLPENVQHKRHRRDDPLHHPSRESSQSGFRHHHSNSSPSSASNNLMSLHNPNLNSLGGIGPISNADYLGFFNKPTSSLSSVVSSLASASSPANSSPSTTSATNQFSLASQSNSILDSSWPPTMLQSHLNDNLVSKHNTGK